jgi:predicted outer membrane repeat protein
MAIVSTDIKKYLSGGAGNSNVAASLGGAISSTEIVDNTINNLFALAAAAESEAGSIKYRGFFVKNTHGTLTAKAAKIYISSNTPSADTTVTIGLDLSSGSPMDDIANEDTAPSPTVTFSTADGVGNALTIGDLAPGASQGIWVKWTITAGAAAVNDAMTITVKAETEA